MNCWWKRKQGVRPAHYLIAEEILNQELVKAAGEKRKLARRIGRFGDRVHRPFVAIAAEGEGPHQ